MEHRTIILDSEISINLNRLAYVVLRVWRRILKSALLVALLFALATSASTALRFYSEESRLKAENEYQIALFSHETEGKNLENDIQNLCISIQQQQDYNTHSLLMQIDPYNKYVATATYYVDTEYQIMPEYQYQDIDYGPRLVELYADYMTGGKMYSEIAARLSGAHEARFIEELFEISAQHSMGMLEIRVCAASEADCREILALISQGMRSKYEQAVQLIGDHSLTVLNETISSVVDTALDETQKQNIQIITDATLTLEEKRDAHDAWEHKSAPEAPFSPQCIAKDILKAAAIGALLGACLILALEILRYLSGDRIYGTQEFQARCALPVLGEIPADGPQKSPLDRWIDRVCGVKLRCSDAEALTAVAAENIAMAANSAPSPAEAVALIGRLSMAEQEQLASAFHRSTDHKQKFFAAGTPLASPVSPRQLQEAGAVVLVEKQGVSTYSDVVDAYQQMCLWEIPVLGIVFTNVDARCE